MIGVHPSIHDLGIKRNESQKKDLLKSQVIMGIFLPHDAGNFKPIY